MPKQLDAQAMERLERKVALDGQTFKRALETAAVRAYLLLPGADQQATAQIDDQGRLTIWGKEDGSGQKPDCTPKDFAKRMDEALRLTEEGMKPDCTPKDFAKRMPDGSMPQVSQHGFKLGNLSSVQELAESDGIPRCELRSALKEAFLNAYLLLPGADQQATAQIDDQGRLTIWGKEDGSGQKPDCTPKDFAKQSVKIVKSVLRNLENRAKEERDAKSFLHLKGHLLAGIVREDKKDADNVHVIIGSGRRRVPGEPYAHVEEIEAILPKREQVPGELYKNGDRLRVYALSAIKDSSVLKMVVSRSHPSLVELLFEREVPELKTREISIAKLAREAGSRTKIAVKSDIQGFNAKGALIGPNGMRAKAVVKELKGEKVDIIDYDEDPALYIAAALSPAKVNRVKILSLSAKSAIAYVSESQLRLAIGSEGQNVRLAVRLTGWKIAIEEGA